MSDGRLASGFANSGDWEVALQQAVKQLPRLRMATANLGFVYFSDQFAPAADLLLNRLRQATGIQNWVGASAVGVLSDHGAALDAAGIALLVGDFADDSFSVFSGRKPLARAFGAYSAIVHGDPHTPDMSELVHDMAGKVRADNVAGGLASGRANVFHVASDVLTGGLSGVAFDQSVQIITGVSQGCAPLPGSWRVTKAQDNLIEAIDTRPALEVFKEAIGPVLGADLRRPVRTVQIGLAASNDDRRLYTVRRIVCVDVRRGSIAINDNIDAGQNLVIVRQDEYSAREDLQAMLIELRDACPTPPRGGIYVSCMSRGGAMFERDETEVEMIAEVFGDIPLAGYFAAGEIVGGRLFGYTGALTLFL